MAKQKSAAPVAGVSVTAERAARLYRLLSLLGAAGQTRAVLLRRLEVNVRGFYRDLETLRGAGITIALVKNRYRLAAAFEDAVERLPFPDLGLTLGEVRQLAKGRGAAHKKLQAHLKRIEK